MLSLFPSQNSYSQNQAPGFDVDVVSTSTRTCAFNVGPGHLSLVIQADGHQVWSLGGCAAAGRGTLLTDLARGVPAIVVVSWSLETSPGGCRASEQLGQQGQRGAARLASPGSYTASASDGGIASNVVTFKVGV